MPVLRLGARRAQHLTCERAYSGSEIVKSTGLLLSWFSTCEFFRAKRIFHLSLVSQLEPSGTNWIKTKEKFASREKIREWKTGFRSVFKSNARSLKLGIFAY